MGFLKLKQAVRILFHQKQITLINIFGLSVSLACALFMLLWVEHELSFDRFHADFKRLYRVEEDQFYTGAEPFHVNVTPHVSGPVWKDEVPEIEEQCRMSYRGGMLFAAGEQKFFEDEIYAVDTSFFTMFNFPMKSGSPASSLRDPYSMILTEELAAKYFGTDDPVGRTILVDQEHTFTVTGVVEELPSNTVLEFKVLIPWSFIQSNQLYRETWDNNSIGTFVKLQQGSVDSVVSRKITQVTDLYKENNTIDYMVAPLHRIHLHSYFGYGRSPGAVLYVYIFSAVALFVLLIACINFMNLSTARSTLRAKEIGLRKVNGASRRILVWQHLFESSLQAFISLMVAILIVLALMNTFNRISGTTIEKGVLLSLHYLLGILGIFLVTTFLAGGYPALYLSSLKPVLAIRDPSDQRRSRGLLRKVLVVFQFSLAIFLVTAAMISSRQLHHMRGADLGFDPSNLVHIRLRGNLSQHYEMLKEEFTRLPGVVSTTAAEQPPYRIGSSSSGIDWEGKDQEMTLLISQNVVHYDFVKTMGIPLHAGRDFSDAYPGDLYRDTTANFMINRTMADLIGKEEVLGMQLRFMGVTGQVIGIIEDYHFQHVGDKIEPLALAAVPAELLGSMVIRIEPGRSAETLRQMEERWEELLPQYPLEYVFVDDVLNRTYETEARMAILLKIFTLVAIIIASLGLFALSSFTAERRTREIGLRKTMGAMERQITWMMIRDFSSYILISLLIALPSVGYLAQRWLNEFSSRIILNANLFLITTLITVLVAILTVLYHAVRIARTNPIEALRYE